MSIPPTIPLPPSVVMIRISFFLYYQVLSPSYSGNYSALWLWHLPTPRASVTSPFLQTDDHHRKQPGATLPPRSFRHADADESLCCPGAWSAPVAGDEGWWYQVRSLIRCRECRKCNVRKESNGFPLNEWRKKQPATCAQCVLEMYIWSLPPIFCFCKNK